MAFHISDLWEWRGTVGRTKYLAAGAFLFGLKHLIDRVIASAVFGQPWGLFNYWIPADTVELTSVPVDRLRFYATLVAVALPFIWVGVALTIRRLRDIGWPLWLTFLFFVPFINLLFFAVLSSVPSRLSGEKEWRFLGLGTTVGRFVPRGAFGSAVAGVLLTSFIGVGAAILSANGLGTYGWGLFVGLPFFLGLTSVLVYGFHEQRSIGMCLAVSLASVAVASGAVLALAFEGLICLIMAAPLGIVMALIGGTVGYIIQRRPTVGRGHTFSALLLAFPTLMVAESAVPVAPALREVRSSVTIKASPETVWNHLVAFAELPSPDDYVFQSGIAYPIRAEIRGSGVGAVRYCVFSTGAFEEPIEVWDEPFLLRFGVTAQPPVMHEWSPFANVRPPHLDSYLQSRRGQFRLSKLSNGETLLEGTTWYQNKFWPAGYWYLWSDQIIHRIHLRVLEHIKTNSELQRQPV